VGAGFAGLAAARRLRNRGKSVALVEARDRVGGRVWNRTAADGSVVSVGGTWLGKRQDRMFELCRELGVEVYPQSENRSACPAQFRARILAARSHGEAPAD
jgi:monoamine oxidase